MKASTVKVAIAADQHSLEALRNVDPSKVRKIKSKRPKAM